MRKVASLIILIFLFSSTKAQDFDLLRSLDYSLGFTQVKEEMNYGLVFTGHMHKFTYRNSWAVNKKNMLYEGSFGVGPSTSREMPGLHFHLKPVDLLWNLFEYLRTIRIAAGPLFKMEYNYALYPELQSDYSFYHSNIMLGLGVSVKYESDQVYLRLRIKNSLAGLVARQEMNRDPYFFELSPGTYFRDQHRNFKAGSFNMFNNTLIELLYVNPLHPRFGYSYTFEYFMYKNSPKVQALSHTITLFFYPKT